MSFRASQLTFEAVATDSTTPPKYTLTFTLPSTGKPYQIHIYRSAFPEFDSTLVLGADNATISFSNISEEEIEGPWTVSFRDTAGDDLVTDTLVIPNSAVTTTTDAGGLDPQPSNINITLTGESSPYINKKLKLSNFKLMLETFSLASEYNPAKTYSIPNGARAVMLEANDYVPSSFGEDREDWLLYSIIVEGEDYPITPKNRIGDHPQIYHLNSALSGPVRAVREENGEAFIDSDFGKIVQIGVKIELGRPDTQGSATPVVFGYKLKYISYDA